MAQSVDSILSKMQDVEEEIMDIGNREDLREALHVVDNSMKCIKARVKQKLYGMQD